MIPRALVTGGNGRLGSAVARLLVDSGYEVHVTLRDRAGADAFAQSPGGRGLVAHGADLGDDADVRALFTAIGPPLAALVHTVGGFMAGPFAETDEASLEAQEGINLRSALLTMRSAHGVLAANPGGAAAVLTVNRPALLGSGPGVALTTAMKAGVVSLVRSLAEEWKEAGIRVNAVAPGIMDTPENRRDMPKGDPSRWPTPDAVARVIRLLLSDDARIVSGAIVPAYGRS
ncbi:MAG: SDR family NAD(P)-dependent oxidoreductase [Candidatus Eiseniibacteriota bacterium]